MVLCIIPGCGVKSGNKEGISLFRIPVVVDKNGESCKQLTEDRRNAWISQISRDDTKSKDILKSERVCGRHFLHFVSGKPALLWKRYNVDWKPALNLGTAKLRSADGCFLACFFPRLETNSESRSFPGISYGSH